MRLSSLSPDFLPTTLVDALRTLGIVSGADLCFSATLLEIWRRLPPDLMPLSQFECCARAVMARCAMPGLAASELDGRPVSGESKPETSTGVGDLDNLLGTTLRDSVVEVSGRNGSGTSVRPPFLKCPYSRLKRLFPGGDAGFKVARTADRMQSPVPEPERNSAVDRYDRRLFPHESGHRPQINRTA